MNIILRPISKNAWPGVLKYKNCYTDIQPYYTRSGRIYTGLTDADADRLGKALGLDLSPGAEMWKEYFIRTFGKDLYLNINDPQDELRYLFLKNHKNVKRSFAEHKATAGFVLINKEEEAKRANTVNEAKLEALTGFTKLTPDEMRKCLRLYGRNASSLSDQIVKNRLFDIVEGDPLSFLNKWVHNSQRETEYLIEAALANNVIRRSNNIYKYGSDIIGHTLAETIDFLDNPKNQDIKIIVTKQTEVKGFGDSIEDDEEKKVVTEGVKVKQEPIEDIEYTKPSEVEEIVNPRGKRTKKNEDTI